MFSSARQAAVIWIMEVGPFCRRLPVALGAAEHRVLFFVRAGSLQSVTLESRAPLFLAMRVGVFWRRVRKPVPTLPGRRERVELIGRAGEGRPTSEAQALRVAVRPS
jgi:hypothetical protein